MTTLLTKLFVKDHQNVTDTRVRASYGSMAGIVGIILNFLLFVAKFVIGALSGSISITADSINNLSDAGSSVLSLITFKISSKPADREHPYGHARIEYVSSMIVSFIILIIGYQLFRDSIEKILNPTNTEFSIVLVIVLALSIVAKFWLGIFYRKIAKKIDSATLRAASADSFSDTLSTTAVLVAMIILKLTELDIDAYMGVAVAVLIVVAGFKILNETKNSILGTSPEPEQIQNIESLISKYPEVLGIHDMLVHNYGPGNTVVSLHAEVDGDCNLFAIHDVIDNIEKHMWEELAIQCTIHLDPIVTNDDRVNAMRADVLRCVRGIDERLNIHDFRFVEGDTHTNLIFDVVKPFEMKMSDNDLKIEIDKKVKEINKKYFTVVTVDKG